MTYGDGSVSVRIIALKSKYLVPVKTQTIPRLELLGATILSCLIHAILHNLSTKQMSIFGQTH